ncbi:hypothetical protein LTV02_01410 [Nocardia yamanashiensis]|nr:hypothetical protein [Nocardia yamanashiensis]UGT46061.1 hypothetical protein LTV02_01410 [Nocardia yamanashiensis]
MNPASAHAAVTTRRWVIRSEPLIHRIRLTPNLFQDDAGDLSATTRKPRG